MKRKVSTGEKSMKKRKVGNCINSILNPFPNEIWSYIFSFITEPQDALRVKLVCKGFKSLVEREFDHSYNENLPFWYCFRNGYLKECKRLLTSQKDLPTLVRDLFNRYLKIADSTLDTAWTSEQISFFNKEILPTLKTMDTIPEQVFPYLAFSSCRNILLLDWALSHQDFPSRCRSTYILEQYYPIDNMDTFFDLVKKILPKIYGFSTESEEDVNRLRGLVKYACSIGSLEACQALAKYFNGFDFDDIRLACESRNLPLVEYLNELCGSGEYINKIFGWACGSGDMEYISFLIRCPRIKIGFNTQAPLRMACRNGHTDVVRFLLDRKADPSVKGQEALINAAESNSTPLVKLLLDHHKIVNLICSAKLFSTAVRNNNTDLFTVLVNHPKINDFQDVFEEVVVLDKPKFVRLLLKSDKFNRVSIVEQGLAQAIQKESGKLVTLILEYYQVNNSNVSILFNIMSHDCLYILKLVVETGKFNLDHLFEGEPLPRMLRFINQGYKETIEYIFSLDDIQLGINSGEFVKQVCSLELVCDPIIGLILDHPSFELSDIWKECFQNAIRCGNIHTTRHLLNKEFVDPCGDNWFALQEAHRIRNFNLIELILERVQPITSQPLQVRLLSFIKGQTFTDRFEKNAFLLRIANKDLSLVKNVINYFLSQPEKVACNERDGCLFLKESKCLNNSRKLLEILQPFCHCGHIERRLQGCSGYF